MKVIKRRLQQVVMAVLLIMLVAGNIRTANAAEVVPIGGLSRIFTWISIMQLEEEGLVSLDGDISAYLPDKFFKHLKYDEPVTILHLMNSNAGWELCYKATEGDNLGDGQTLQDYLKKIEPVQLYEPGYVRIASDYYPVVASLIIETVSGQPYEDYVRCNILEPLGMTDTVINFSGEVFFAADGAASTEEDMTKLMEQLLYKKTGDNCLFKYETTYDSFLSLSYKINEAVNGVAHGLNELEGSAYTVGITTRHEGRYIIFALCPEKELSLVHLSEEPVWLAEQFGFRTYTPDTEALPYTKGINYEFIAASVASSSCGELQGYLSMRDAIVLKEPNGISKKQLYVYYRINSLNYFGAEELIPIFEEVEQIAPYTYVDDSGEVYALVFEGDEPVKLITADNEYIKCEWYQSLSVVNLSILYLYLDAAIAVMLLPLLFFTWISNRMKYYKPIGASKFILPYSICYILLTINNTVLLLHSYANEAYKIHQLHFMLNYVLTAALIACAVIILRLWKKSELYMKQKIGYILLLLASLVKIIYMAAWQLY